MNRLVVASIALVASITALADVSDYSKRLAMTVNPSRFATADGSVSGLPVPVRLSTAITGFDYTDIARKQVPVRLRRRSQDGGARREGRQDTLRDGSRRTIRRLYAGQLPLRRRVRASHKESGEGTSACSSLKQTLGPTPHRRRICTKS